MEICRSPVPTAVRCRQIVTEVLQPPVRRLAGRRLTGRPVGCEHEDRTTGSPLRKTRGALNIDLVEDAIHLSTGGLLTYLGFARVEDRIVRTAVGGLGVVYLAVGIVSFFVPDLFGLIPHEYSGLDNAIHLTLGVLGIGAAVVPIGAERRLAS